MKAHIGVDVGGTFTDLAYLDSDGNISVVKSPTTPGDYPRGIEDCIDLVAGTLGLSVEQVLGTCERFIHGSTVVTNAVVEGRVAKVGLITTRGFRDVLTLREGGKEDPYNLREPYPQPFVPRHLTMAVTERVTAEGDVETPLDEWEVRQAVKTLVEMHHVEALAVCFLWSIANPLHELRVREIVQAEWPGVPCVISCEVNPIVREYRRAISTAIEAAVRPIARVYVENLDARLARRGYRGTLRMVSSAGSIMAARSAGDRGLAMIGSGPAMAPVGGRWLAGLEEFGSGNLLVTDMGGTSFDITVVSDGEVARTRETRIGPETLGVRAIDSRSIGAGGGSVAWVDSGGLVRIGPESAGARPGPACYGLGGTAATVTDANVVLGYIAPESLLGSRLTIDLERASDAIRERVALPLGIGVDEAAYAVYSTVTVDMASAIQDVTIWHGIDPRAYGLVSGGGAGNCHAVALAKGMRIPRVLVPKFGGALSAVGGLIADMAADFNASYFTSSHDFDFEGVARILSDLEGRAAEFVNGIEGDTSSASVDFSVEARYSYQVWDLPVRLRTGSIRTQADLSELVEDFHAVHQRVFGVAEPGQAVEFVNWLARAVVPSVKPQLKELPMHVHRPHATRAREAYFKELGGKVSTRVFSGWQLTAGGVIEGPSIIEEATTTIVIPPHARATVTRFGNYLIETEV